MEVLSIFFTRIPFDFLVLFGVAFLIALDAMRTGVGRAVALAFALLAATVLHTFADTTIGIASAVSSDLLEAVFFGVLVVLMYLIARRMGLEYIGSGGQVLSAVISGFALACILIVVWLSVPVLSTYYEFGGLIQTFFAEQFRFFWLFGSLAALVFARG